MSVTLVKFDLLTYGSTITFRRSSRRLFVYSSMFVLKLIGVLTLLKLHPYIFNQIFVFKRTHESTHTCVHIRVKTHKYTYKLIYIVYICIYTCILEVGVSLWSIGLKGEYL